MDSETESQAQAAKFQTAMMLHNRYRPEQGRADRLSSNIPGSPSPMGTVGDHTIGHGGSN